MPHDQNARRPQTRPFVKVVGMMLLLVLIASAVLAVGPSLTTSAAPAPSGPAPSMKPAPSPPAEFGPPQFTSCYDVWASGAGPFLAGEPGYSAALDPDGDGIACPSKPK